MKDGTSSMSAPHADAICARQAARPDTPCVAVCSTTFDDICRGCGRTVVEVAHWVSMSADHKEQVWQRILAEGYPRRNT
jgi:predicted Fe-S protein YdhL (DUF1289 family)